MEEKSEKHCDSGKYLLNGYKDIVYVSTLSGFGIWTYIRRSSKSVCYAQMEEHKIWRTNSLGQGTCMLNYGKTV